LGLFLGEGGRGGDCGMRTIFIKEEMDREIEKIRMHEKYLLHLLTASLLRKLIRELEEDEQ